MAVVPVSPEAIARPGGLESALVWIFLIVWGGLSIALFTARALHPGPESGEYWSDSNVINSCRAYDNQGFLADYGLPRFQTGTAAPDTSALYLTYPPGPNWITYAAWRTGASLGIDPLLAARLFAQAIGVLGGLLVFWLFARLSGSRGLGALGGLFYILSLPYTSYSAAVHHMSYSPALLFGAMLAWLAFERGVHRRRWAWLALTGLLYAAECWTNLEHIVFFAAFVAVRTICCFRWPVVIGAALVGPIPIPMMALRVAHNGLVQGGWSGAMDAFSAAATRRSSGGSTGLNLIELRDAWLRRLGADFLGTADHHRSFPVLDGWVLAMLVVVLAAGLLAWRVRRRSHPRRHLPVSLIDPATTPARDLLPVTDPRVSRVLFYAVPPLTPVARGALNGLLLLGGGLTWFVVMTEHTLVHSFIILLLMPGLALLLGTAAYASLSAGAALRPRDVGPIAWWARARCALAVILLLAVFAQHLRRSDVLNQLIPLDPASRERIVHMGERNRLMPRLAQRLRARAVTRIVYLNAGRWSPFRAASTDMLFTFAPDAIPRTLHDDQALYIEVEHPPDREHATRAMLRWGIPWIVGPADDRALVFTAPSVAPAPDAGLDLRLDPPVQFDAGADQAAVAAESEPADGAPPPPGTPGKVTITQLRWARCIGSEGATLSLLALAPDMATSGQIRERDRLGHRFNFAITLRDASGVVVVERITRLGWAVVRRQGVALLAIEFTADEMARADTAELAIWDRRDGHHIAFDDVARLGLERLEGGRTLRWSARLPTGG